MSIVAVLLAIIALALVDLALTNDNDDPDETSF
jgi:hypothetical protein